MVAFVFDRRSLVLLGTGAVFLALVLVAVGFLLGVQYGVLPPAAPQAAPAQANQAMLPTRVTGMADGASSPDTADPGFGDSAGMADTEPADDDGSAEPFDRSAESLPYADGPAGDETAPADQPAAMVPAEPSARSTPPAAAPRFDPPADPIVDSRGGEPVALAPSPPSVPGRTEREVDAASPPTEGAAPDAPSAVSAAVVTSDSGRFAVQVGAYRERLNSDAMVQKLSARGFEPYVVEIQRDGQPPIYAVRVGRFGDRAAAVKAASALRSKAGVSVVVLSIG